MAGSWQRARVMAARWMAALIWRLPPRQRRWTSRVPREPVGAVPLWRA